MSFILPRDWSHYSQSDGPDEPDLLVFGSLLPSQSTLRMTVARVMPPRPPAPRPRAPRPDDPAPRRPPVFELSGRNAANKRRRVEHEAARGESGGKAVDLKTLVAREVMFRLPRGGAPVNAKAKGKARADGQTLVFKVPGLPAQSPDDEDVFGLPAAAVSSKTGPGELEVSNKAVSRVLSAICRKLIAQSRRSRRPQ